MAGFVFARRHWHSQRRVRTPKHITRLPSSHNLTASTTLNSVLVISTAVFLVSLVLHRLVSDCFPMDAEIDLEAFSNDIAETAGGWGGGSLDADAGE